MKYQFEYSTRFSTTCYYCAKEDAVWTAYNPETDSEALVCESCKQSMETANE